MFATSSPQANPLEAEIETHGLEVAPAPVSKNALKRRAREQRLQERKKRRKDERRALKAQKKIDKRRERQENLRNFSPEEREKILAERIRVMREGRAQERARRAHVREILTTRTKYNVCIDLGWNQAMYEKEQKSLARQLAYSYNALRKTVDDGLVPIRLSICGIDDVIKPVLSFVANGWQSWPVQLSDKNLVETHDPRRLVYLTHESTDVLEELDPDDVYIIGGIVDRNRLKGATLSKAKELGIRTARLNLDSNLTLQHGTPVLTVNHCVEILTHAANGLTWKDAYRKVLPVRKGVVLKSGSQACTESGSLHHSA